MISLKSTWPHADNSSLIARCHPVFLYTHQWLSLLAAQENHLESLKKKIPVFMLHASLPETEFL